MSETRSRQLTKRMVFLADDLQRRKPGGDVVLAYHRVGGHTPSPVDLPTALFTRQMAHVRAAERVMGIDSLIEVDRPSLGTSRVVVTFDDGTSDFVDEALPVLVKYRIPATLYLATEFVDSGRRYPADGVPISWDGLREAMSTGLVTIGAHTHTHRLLDRCSVREAEFELDTCIGRIEDELGETPHHFAYPKACAPTTGPVESLVRERFRSAAVAGTRPNIAPNIDPWRLYRSPVQNADGWEGFVRKVDGGMRVEDDLRRVVNLVRYRGKVA